MCKRNVFVVIVVAGLLFAAAAAATSCDERCRHEGEENTIRIDARTGKIHPKDNTQFPMGGSTTFSFYTGPSFGFVDEQLFFTLGYYQEKVKELSGFKLGDTVPDSLMDQLPIREESKGGLLLTVTYKLR